MKIGIIREGKVPKDERAPFSPEQCQKIKATYPQVHLVVQKSSVRRFTDDEYVDCGIDLVDQVTDCDILLGIKEVPIDQLIPNKIYFFFSHTIKQQPHNRELLKTLLDFFDVFRSGSFVAQANVDVAVDGFGHRDVGERRAASQSTQLRRQRRLCRRNRFSRASLERDGAGIGSGETRPRPEQTEGPG